MTRGDRMAVLLAVMAWTVVGTTRGLAAAPASLPATQGTIALAPDFDPQQYTTKAKLTMQQAVALALQRVPGRVAWAGLEDYRHSLYFSVEVVEPARTVKMVTLDAGTGAVTAVETPEAKAEATVDVGDAPAAAESEKGGVPKESPELSMVKGTIKVPEGAKDTELAYLTTTPIEQAMRSIARKYRGAFLAISVYREKETVMFGLELVQPGNKHTYFYYDPGKGKILDTTKW